MGASIIDGGVYSYLAYNHLYVFNTSSGSVVHTAISVGGGGMTTRCSVYDYPTNSVFFFGQWASAATPPYPVGGISPSGTEYWYRLQIGDVPTLPGTSGGGKIYKAIMGPVFQ